MLLRKMLRDLWNHKGTYIASMILITIGILVYTAFSMLHDSFGFSIYKYYDDFNFADGTIKVVEMPIKSVGDIQRLSGIYKAEGRLEKRVRMLNYDNEITFHFISYDSLDKKRLNNIQLLSGRMPDPSRDEVIIGNNYFGATDMKLGDNIEVVINGRKKQLTIVGTGRSPEFIYAKKNDSELISDPETFDIVFMPYKSMADLFGLNGQVNNVAIKLYKDVKLEDMKTDIKEVIYKYGILQVTDREDQMSHITTKQKLDGIGSMTASIPIMFLAVSAFIINIVLKRVIEQERTQIGVLKAFGIQDFRILMHYISYALLVSIVGGGIGMYFGLRSLDPFVEQMAVGFNMPFITKGLYQKYFINSAIICLIFGLASGYSGARSCLKLEAAEAMRPPVSKESKAGILDRFYFLIENFDIKLKLTLRNIFRNKGRSLFVLFGISITAALLTFPIAMNEMYEKMLVDQFTKVEVYDTKISMSNYYDRDKMVSEISNKDGITRVEPMTQIPITIYNKWWNKDSLIIAIPTDSTFYNLYDMEQNRVKLNHEGIMLGHWLAEKIGVTEGDFIKIKSPMFKDDEYKELRVSKIIPQYIGSNAYMNIDLVPDLLDGRDVANILMISGSDDGITRVNELYSNTKSISSFDDRAAIAQGFLEFMEQATTVVGLLVVVGLIVGFAVIYVSLTISLSERHRELATMLVVGLREKEVHQILIMEQALISVFGIILGIPLGRLMLDSMANTSSTEFLIMPKGMPLKAALFSILLTIISIAIPQLFARRKIEKIVVTEALNARE